MNRLATQLWRTWKFSAFLFLYFTSFFRLKVRLTFFSFARLHTSLFWWLFVLSQLRSTVFQHKKRSMRHGNQFIISSMVPVIISFSFNYYTLLGLPNLSEEQDIILSSFALNFARAVLGKFFSIFSSKVMTFFSIRYEIFSYGTNL